MCTLADLVPHPATTPADQLLIAALRCHAAGAGCDLLGFFDLVFGPRAAPPAAQALACFARTLFARARRPVRLGQVGDPPTPDEIAAARLVAALSHQDPQDAARRLVWLVPRAGRAAVLASAATLAQALAGHLAVAAEQDAPA